MVKMAYMRWVYISPHLDDSALSAGGLIHEQASAGVPVEIWTIMAGFPPDDELSTFAALNHHLWGYSSARETITARQAEDRAAASILGARAVHFDFLDCIYRRGPDGDWLYIRDIASPPQPGDADLPARIAAALTERLHPDDVLVCQLAVGRHVDHVIVRRACELLERPLLYLADIPYLFDHPGDLVPNLDGMHETVKPVSNAGFQAWVGSVWAYGSQLSSLFESPEGLHMALEKYWGDKRGISLWQAGG
jgi:LmbE family N-acetylglucosaminyl deacetylase